VERVFDGSERDDQDRERYSDGDPEAEPEQDLSKRHP
jgi:hypothetical protein